MTGRLRTLDLLQNKHIPPIYLRASERQRRALLAGLLDTDGTINRCGAVEFTTTSPQLAQDVYELVCSLGFRPALRQGIARLNGVDCGPKWTLAFTTGQEVFRLERKTTTQKERLRNYSPERNRFRYVVAVNPVPSRPVRCIQVAASSHLYLAGRSMIPTHNSLAYLISIVRSGKVAIVSTANKALQEQLFFKDIPFIQKYIRHIDAALVKGMGNYICLDRVAQEQHTGLQHYTKNSDFQRLLERIQESDERFAGDFEMLGFTLPADIRGKVNADRDQCTWSKCSYFGDCYVHKMKTRASLASIIVVNHTLLLLDAFMEGKLLPERDVIIVDEAHHLEEEATRAFTTTISPGQVATLLAQNMLKNHTSLSLQDETRATMNLAWEQLGRVADPGSKGRANLREPLQEGLGLASMVDKLADALRTGRPKDLDEKDEQLYDKLITRAQNLAGDIRLVFSVNQSEKYVYYVESAQTGRRGSSNKQLEVSAAPLEVTSWLKEQLFDKSNVICTSATLATIGPDPARPEVKGPNFAYFRRRVGLDHASYPDAQERILPLTFDYEDHALLYLPRHIPEPAYGDGPAVQEYTNAIGREMIKLVEASRGRAFLLFSSKRMLEEVFRVFERELPPHLKFPLLRQGDMTRIDLVRNFREREGAVLFGLKSFWEGVDIAGEALSLVVIDKLPFDPPDDPVHEARVAQMKAAGENWFGIYVLPQTVLRLKQGLGRLLRTHSDRGVMAILDTRLYTKSYGKQIVQALPPARRAFSMETVTRFFQESDEDEDEAPF
jgi:Rad3-related DNA helicase